MSAAIRSLISLFLSLTILLIGHGLQQTLLPLYAQSIGWSPAEVGLTGSAYFLGLILGCLSIPMFIRRVGHIRVFAACAGLAIMAILMTAKWEVLTVWLLCRAVIGLSFAGLYMIFESWLNEQSPNEMRGYVLSFYGFLSLAAMVESGTKLGVISAPYSSDETVLLAETDGIVICVSSLPLVNEGEALFHIARFEEATEVEDEIFNHQVNIEEDRLFEIEEVPVSDTDSVS